MLSNAEKNHLYELVSAVIGEDHSIKAYKPGFNDTTIEVVENMIEQNFQCNANMKELFKELLGGAARLSKGWLKKLLKAGKKKVSRSELKGYGCRASVKSKRDKKRDKQTPILFLFRLNLL